MSIDRAIAKLDEEILSFNNGTKQQPAEGSTEWFLLRAKTLGRSALKRMRDLGVNEDPEAAEKHYRHSLKGLKGDAVVED